MTSVGQDLFVRLSTRPFLTNCLILLLFSLLPYSQVISGRTILYYYKDYLCVISVTVVLSSGCDFAVPASIKCVLSAFVDILRN